MKLSEMSTDQSMDVICEVMPFIGNITADKKITKMIIEKVQQKEGQKIEQLKEEAFAKGVNKFVKLIPMLLSEKGHREDVYNIISVMNRKTIEEIKGQSPVITIKEIKEIVADEELMKLFF